MRSAELFTTFDKKKAETKDSLKRKKSWTLFKYWKAKRIIVKVSFNKSYSTIKIFLIISISSIAVGFRILSCYHWAQLVWY